jgi:predicted ferric reductase
VEGPYGRFNFHGTRARQIWVGAGIGITLFVARMRALSQAGGAEGIDLFHTTKIFDPEAIGLLENDARDAGVALHVLWDQRDGLLTAAQVVRQVPDWRDADLWFCGPARFGESLRKDLVAMGLPRARFHQELFELR